MAVTTGDDSWWVVCLCAAWCGVCREYQPAFEQQAAAHPGVRFAWVDVEDESEAMGDIDIETFPSLLVAQGSRVLFLGPVLPAGAQLARLLASLQAAPVAPAGAGPAEQALFARLRAEVLPPA
ncbi:MAG: thioredoxin [Comamonadaceae bacterium]|nr:MAG: thioredoxin [Comamonadaceae bacterium]